MNRFEVKDRYTYGYSVKEKCLVMNKEFPKRLSKARAIAFSIEKWQTIVDYHTSHPDSVEHVRNGGMGTCALCYKYGHRLDLKESCKDCPIYTRTGMHFCMSTPLVKYADSVGAKKALLHAQKMVKFLQSLL